MNGAEVTSLIKIAENISSWKHFLGFGIVIDASPTGSDLQIQSTDFTIIDSSVNPKAAKNNSKVPHYLKLQISVNLNRKRPWVVYIGDIIRFYNFEFFKIENENFLIGKSIGCNNTKIGWQIYSLKESTQFYESSETFVPSYPYIDRRLLELRKWALDFFSNISLTQLKWRYNKIRIEEKSKFFDMIAQVIDWRVENNKIIIDVYDDKFQKFQVILPVEHINQLKRNGFIKIGNIDSIKEKIIEIDAKIGYIINIPDEFFDSRTFYCLKSSKEIDEPVYSQYLNFATPIKSKKIPKYKNSKEKSLNNVNEENNKNLKDCKTKDFTPFKLSKERPKLNLELLNKKEDSKSSINRSYSNKSILSSDDKDDVNIISDNTKNSSTINKKIEIDIDQGFNDKINEVKSTSYKKDLVDYEVDNLSQIEQNNIYSGFGVLIDSNKWFKENDLYKTTVRIIDSSINPEEGNTEKKAKYITFYIYSSSENATPKVNRLGDILRFHRFHFKKYNENNFIYGINGTNHHTSWELLHYKNGFPSECYGHSSNIKPNSMKVFPDKINELRKWLIKIFMNKSIKGMLWHIPTDGKKSFDLLCKIDSKEIKNNRLHLSVKLENQKIDLLFKIHIDSSYNSTIEPGNIIKLTHIVAVKWPQIIPEKNSYCVLNIPNEYIDAYNFDKISRESLNDIKSNKVMQSHEIFPGRDDTEKKIVLDIDSRKKLSALDQTELITEKQSDNCQIVLNSNIENIVEPTSNPSEKISTSTKIKDGNQILKKHKLNPGFQSSSTSKYSLKQKTIVNNDASKFPIKMISFFKESSERIKIMTNKLYKVRGVLFYILPNILRSIINYECVTCKSKAPFRNENKNDICCNSPRKLIYDFRLSLQDQSLIDKDEDFTCTFTGTGSVTKKLFPDVNLEDINNDNFEKFEQKFELNVQYLLRPDIYYEIVVMRQELQNEICNCQISVNIIDIDIINEESIKFQ